MLAADPSRAHARPTCRVAALVALAALCAACSNDNTTTATTPSTPAGTVTETLNGTMAPKGTAIRTFVARQAGTVTVLLSKTDPSMTLGLGVGIPAATGSDCKFSQTVNTQAGTAAQLSVGVDPGTYCAGAYDLGNVGSSGVVVTVTVTHP